MTYVSTVAVDPLPPDRFTQVLGRPAADQLLEALGRAATVFQGRVIWNVNSTATGGGVAELLRSLLAYARGADVDVRWAVIKGNPDFFDVTKRIHNHLHNFIGDGGELGDGERAVYEEALRPNAEEFRTMVAPGDVVILHDPQTAGLVPMVKDLGVPVVWRCHVGIDEPGQLARAAWDFLRPYVVPADAYVFSRQAFVWDRLEPKKIHMIPPSIDAFSPKNVELDGPTVTAILVAAGLTESDGPLAQPQFTRASGAVGRVERKAEVFQDVAATSADRLVVQVSRWDSLKDPIGVMEGFARHIAPNSDAHLVYAGPAVEAVADDPEGAEVLRAAIALWRHFPSQQRKQIHLACLPMIDGEENAAMVNALQRRASVVVQKSIAEGFGLTVAEAMWKGRPVVASRIGGIQDQIEDGKTGLLLDDPADLEAYGTAVLSLLADDRWAAAIGTAGMERVRERFLASRSLLQYMQLMGDLIGQPVPD